MEEVCSASLVQSLDWQAGEVEANGIRIAYEECGSPGDDAVILITGLSWQLIHWPDSYCADLVKRGLRVIKIDNRDSGLSSSVKGKIRINFVNSAMMRQFGMRPPADYDLKDMSNDLIGFMDAMSLTKTHLVGFSLGGVVAQLTAARAPERILSLTSLMSTTNDPWLPKTDSAVLLHLMKPTQGKSAEKVIERTVELHKMLMSPGFPTPEQELRELIKTAFERAYNPGGIMRQMHAMVVSGSIESQLRKVRAPTQVVHGDSDKIVPLACGKRIAERIREAKLTVIEGLGHDFPEALMPQFAELTFANIARV